MIPFRLARGAHTIKLRSGDEQLGTTWLAATHGNVTVGLHTLPFILELRDQLGIKPINTGRRLISKHGIVTDDLERLHAVCDKRGRVRLISGTEFSMNQVYRGQTQEHPSCLPKLGRLNTPEEQLLALCRNIAFEDAVADHPFVRMAEHATFLGNPLFIDKEGLAQHYGLPTHIECFRFRHRAKVSMRIWKAFDEGRALFPTDAAAELAIQAELLHQFTHH